MAGLRGWASKPPALRSLPAGAFALTEPRLATGHWRAGRHTRPDSATAAVSAVEYRRAHDHVEIVYSADGGDPHGHVAGDDSGSVSHRNEPGEAVTTNAVRGFRQRIDEPRRRIAGDEALQPSQL